MDIKRDSILFEQQYEDFCDTQDMISNYDDLRFSISTPVQESNGSTTSNHQLVLTIGIKIHWLAGLLKMDKVVLSMKNPHCTEKFEKYTENLKDYLQKRIRMSKCNQYTLRTDCGWKLEETDIQDACNVIVNLLKWDTVGMSVSGELTRSTLKICLNNYS